MRRRYQVAEAQDRFKEDGLLRTACGIYVTTAGYGTSKEHGNHEFSPLTDQNKRAEGLVRTTDGAYLPLDKLDEIVSTGFDTEEVVDGAISLARKALDRLAKIAGRED